MQPHIYVSRGQKRFLLIRSGDQLHRLTMDHRLHRQAEDWLLAEERSVLEMNQRQLSRNSIDLSDIRGVSVTGIGRGHSVQLYMKDGKQRYELDEDCSEETLNILFDGLERFHAPKPKESRHGWQLTQQEISKRDWLWFASGVADTVGLLSSLMVMVSGFKQRWMCGLCLLSIAAGIALYYLFPAYFGIYLKKRRYGERRSAFNLSGAIILCPLALLGAALLHAPVFGWWKAWAIGAMAVAILAVVLWCCLKSFRDVDKLVPFVIMGILLSAGPVLAVNHILDTSPDQEIRTEVVDTRESRGRRGSTHYYLSVMLDEKEVEFSVSHKAYCAYETGDRVTVELYDGALGIPFAILPEE